MWWTASARWRALVAIAVTAYASTAQDASVDVAIARFYGGRFGRELCAGVLLAPTVVLTTAHCALSPQLASVDVSVAAAVDRQGINGSSNNNMQKKTVMTKQSVILHPQFGATHALANNVALVFLDDNDAWSPPNRFPDIQQTTIAADGSSFQEIHVQEGDTVEWTVRPDLSRNSCASSPEFSGDETIWCSREEEGTLKERGVRLYPLSSSSSSEVGCSSSVKTALGSPVVVRTKDQDSRTDRLVVVGLRLTADSCAEDQAFMYIPSVLDFILPHLTLASVSSSLSPASSLEPDHSLFDFRFETTTTAIRAVGKVSPGEDQSSSFVAAADDTPSSSASSSSGGSSSLSSNDDVVFLRGSLGSGPEDVDNTATSREPSVTNFIGGWATQLPSLGAYSSFAALVVQNTTEEYGELQGCVGVLIAPKYMVADGQCLGTFSDPQVVISAGNSSTINGSRLYSVVNIVYHQDYSTTLAILELKDAITEMTPLAISRSLPKEYQATDESWELVAMDNLFASQRADQAIIATKSIVRLPATTCDVYHAEEVPFSWCLAMGSERDRQYISVFSQGFLLHESKLVALPQCYAPICMGGLFHDAAFLAAKEDWIRNQTQDTALWDMGPFDTANISHDIVQAADGSFAPVGSTYAILESGDDETTTLCNGVLIAPAFVLTTASCVASSTVSHVRLGLDQRVSTNTIEDTMSVRRVYIHPEFGKPTTSNESNDLALVELGGMSYFLPTRLALHDNILQPQNDTADTSSSTSTSSDSGFLEVEVATLIPTADTTKYSWPISVSPLDTSILCGHEAPTAKTSELSESVSSGASDSSASGEPATLEVVRCSTLKTLSGKEIPGTGLIAAFSDGNVLLGIATNACSRVDSSNKEAAVGSAAICPSGVDSPAPDSCYARVATSSSKSFIDSISVDHFWRGASSRKFLPDTSFETMQKVDASTILPADDPGYTGSLHYDSMPADVRVGFVVGLRNDKSGQNFCGGSLIAPSYVLTAAHCVLGGEAKYVSVGSKVSAGTETELIPIKQSKVIVHPMYGKQSSISYDVAIIELEIQAYPAPIQLDNVLRFDASSTEFTLYGYGANSAKSTSLSPVMRSVELPFYSRDACAKYFPELDDSMLCAGGELARDACTGDSGSPLVYYQDGNPVLVGVVSTGRNGCGTPGVPGIYGYVSNMQAFVNSYVAGCSWLDPDKVVGPLQTKMTLGSATHTSSSSSASQTPAELRTSLDEGSVPFEIIHSATGTDEHQLSVVKLASDTPDLLHDAILDYLLGDFNMVGGVWASKSKEIRKVETSITLYSSGNMADLMKTIAKYRAKPLYQRKNRFAKEREELKSDLHTNCCHGI